MDRWQRPASGRLKWNVDASLSTSHNKVGISMCIRDVDGEYVFARTTRFAPLCSVDIDEALGLYEAL